MVLIVQDVISYIVNRKRRFNRSLILWIIVLSVVTYSATTLAQDADSQSDIQPFPKILTLSEALSMVDAAHPQMLKLGAERAYIDADQYDIDANYGLQSNFYLEYRQSDRIAQPGHDFIDDSRATLTLDKPISDFGRRKLGGAAVETKRMANQMAYESRISQLRISVMRAFFDVVIADYAYAALDEEMTLSFLSFDRAKDKMEKYGEISEIEVTAMETEYLNAFARRGAAANQQRASRLVLALALNRPDAYPDQVVEPDISAYQRQIPDYEEIIDQVLEQNPEIRNEKALLLAAKQELKYLQTSNRPVLGARFEATEYNDQSSLRRDQFRGSLYLDIPIGPKPASRGRIARQQGLILNHEANIQLLESKVRLELLRLLQALEHLQLELAAAESELLYRELDLDKVRLLYEMEVRAQIGSANTHVANALLRLTKAQYSRIVHLEMLDALTGRMQTEQ